MEHIGIDVHKRESQVCVLGEAGEVVLERRVPTQREKLAALLGQRPKARVLLESSTESEWVARCLEELGREVGVADPNLAVRGRVNGPRQGRLNGSRLLIAQDWPLAAGCPTPARGGRVKGAEPFRFRRSRPLTLPSTRAATNDR